MPGYQTPAEIATQIARLDERRCRHVGTHLARMLREASPEIQDLIAPHMLALQDTLTELFTEWQNVLRTAEVRAYDAGHIEAHAEIGRNLLGATQPPEITH